MDKIPRCTLLDPVDHGKNYGYTSAKNFYEYVDIIHTSNMGSLNPYGHIDFYPNGGIQQPCTCSNPCKGVDCKKSQGTHSRAVVLYRVINFEHLLIQIFHLLPFIIHFCNTSFQESIRGGENDFLAWECQPSDQKKNEMSCPYNDGPVVPMGEQLSSEDHPTGIYYLRTYGQYGNMTCNDESCFVQGNYINCKKVVDASFYYYFQYYYYFG